MGVCGHALSICQLAHFALIQLSVDVGTHVGPPTGQLHGGINTDYSLVHPGEVVRFHEGTSKLGGYYHAGDEIFSAPTIQPHPVRTRYHLRGLHRIFLECINFLLLFNPFPN